MTERQVADAEAGGGGVYVEHQYMCSECYELFNSLEDVLVHQQIHNGAEGNGEQEVVSVQDVSEMEESQQYQCLECGTLLVNSDELLQHQEMHMREAGMEVEHQELCEVLEPDEAGAEGAGPVKYQCLDCLALFDSPDDWLEHRKSHSRSSTHSKTETTEYVLQPDGTITLVNSVQNYVLSDQQAEEILAQVLAQQQQQQLQQQLQQQQQQQQQYHRQHQKKRQLMSKPPSVAAMLPAVSAGPGSATMHLQILTAQALADGSTTPSQRLAKPLPPLLSALGPGSQGKLGLPLENGIQRLEIRLAPGVQGQQQQAEMVVIHPYECSECSLLFQTPEDFLQHQGEHFLGQDKESGEAGVMGGFEEPRGREDVDRTDESRLRAVDKRGAAAWAAPQRCELCHRTFTSANRLAAHRRVHEQGTHECPECGKVFKKATSLQTHMRTHSGVARYLCVDCGHSFTTEMTLIMHRKSHIADPLHKCQVCSKTFTNMTKYLYHRRTHFNRDPAAQPCPASTVLAPRRASLSALTILQRARERREAAQTPEEPNENEDDFLAPLTEEQLQQIEAEGEGGSLGQSGGGEDEGGLAALSSGPSSLLHQAASQVGLVDNPASHGDSVGAPSESHDVAAEAVAPAPPAAGVPDKGAFSCRSCPKAFPSARQLAQHRRKCHAAERPFACGVCTKAFKKQIHMRNHLRTHTGERPFQCSDCGKTFSSLTNLMRHTLIHSGVRPYRCEVCQRTFSQASNLRQHSLLHDATALLACPDCPAGPAVFAGPVKLAAHRYTVHPGAPAPFPCQHCEAGFLTRRRRDCHRLEQHPELLESDTGDPAGETVHGASPATETEGAESGGLRAPARGGLDCDICGKKLNSFSNLRLHRLSHRAGSSGSGGVSAKRPKAHQCPVCGKLFVSSSGMALHQRVHTGERPFPCQVCGKRFRQNTHLREHLRTHSGERPFRCEVCGKGFVQSMHLAGHRHTHTGERPHACPQCGKAFKTFSNLRNHKKTHARQQRLQEEAAATTQVAVETGPAVALVDGGVELANGQPGGVIQIQAADLQQAQGTPTIMCNEFGETIAIIETPEGGTLALEQALEIYHTALENGLTMDTVTVDGLQLL